MALKPGVQVARNMIYQLAVPSYGAMALKPSLFAIASVRIHLAVPSYGAMALKHRTGAP